MELCNILAFHDCMEPLKYLKYVKNHVEQPKSADLKVKLHNMLALYNYGNGYCSLQIE